MIERVTRPGDADAVAFTGSTAAGREIARSCGGDLKRFTLELGGKSAAVVLDDADPSQAATLIALGCMVYSGQACAALTRALIPRARYAEFVEAIDAAIGALPVGDPLDPATVIGPLVAERQLRRALDHIASARESGARTIRGGSRVADRPEGWFLEPTVFGEVDNAMRIAQEEIFGPVLCLIPYETEAGASRLAFDAMVEYLRATGLALQKVPEQLEVLDALPRNALSKVQKADLRARFGAALAG